MPKRYSTDAVIKALHRAGFWWVSQRGSHIKMTDGSHIVIVPAGRKEIRPGTLKSIINQSGLDKSHFEQ